jgi:nitrite reductase/ring-hydroxylating ferredoxin subunit
MSEFHQCWYPVALCAEVDGAGVIGRDFLGTRVVVYREGGGESVVQEAFCPHLGADLSLGTIVDGNLRCPFHHWCFNAEGRCVSIPTGDRIPPGARIATYPSAQAWGIIWAFNGAEPAFGLPRIPDVEEAELEMRVWVREPRPVDPWMAVSNGVDFQHLRTLHGFNNIAPPSVETRPSAIEFVAESSTVLQHGLISGTSTFAQHLRIGTDDTFMLFSGSSIAPRQSRPFVAIGVRRADAPNEKVLQARLDHLAEFVNALIEEDEPIWRTMRFRRGVLTASDRHLSKFLRYVELFPTYSKAG